jgi:lipoyl(octanoyl) transferase
MCEIRTVTMTCIVRYLGRINYEECYRDMRSFTSQRTSTTPDELLICEHEAVYTQGIAGKSQHLLTSSDIPIIQTDRGGQITYHGPGQIVAYPLLDLRRRAYFVKEYVRRLEEAVILTLQDYNVIGLRVANAPGIYVYLHGVGKDRVQRQSTPEEIRFHGLAKIASLGVKVSRHCTYHGLALNVAMNVTPFTRINPCGYSGLAVVDLASLGVTADLSHVSLCLSHHLQHCLD